MAASLLLHLFVGAAVIGAIPAAPPVVPQVIDLTLAEPAKDPGSVPIPGSPAPPFARAISNRPVEIPPANRSDPAASSPASAADFPGSLSAAAVVPASPVVAAGSPQSVAMNTRAANSEGGRKAIPGNPPGVPAVGSPTGDFAGIRDSIQRRIAYPAMARQMGWEGKVVVAFRILADGTARNVRVVQGSGHPVLDRSAAEAVRNASPFPRPPAEAEIITPVVYRLSESQ